MNTLWNKLKPEYKTTIEYYKNEFTSGPQSVEKALKESVFFGELTIDELKNLFIWTDNDLIDIEWKDLFGERFLIDKNK